jgi:hypothetical protein
MINIGYEGMQGVVDSREKGQGGSQHATSNKKSH